MERKCGVFYGVSVGPGDPELLTQKACRVLSACPVIAAPQTPKGGRLALSIAQQAVDLSGKEILSLPFAMVGDEETRKTFWKKGAALVKACLDRGKNVAMAVLGDVSLYATYGYLAKILEREGYETCRIPGVTSPSAASAALGESLTEGNTPLHILPAGNSAWPEVLELPGTKIIMKPGRELGPVLETLKTKHLLEKAALVANCGLEGEILCRDLARLPADLGYYTLLIIKE